MKSLKFAARMTITFILYDLYNLEKEFKESNRDALIPFFDIVGVRIRKELNMEVFQTLSEAADPFSVGDIVFVT